MNEQDWGLNVGYGEGCTGEGWLDLTNDETWVISNGFTGG